ncbi:O-antigen transporter [Methanothermobacter thermautotrophicus str. Delta H]|uniref:O-antigen transporter n=1 Tax=Methanothermobacter thermautotrophicus (strain ATCC 29096 / DSM 1053 / JCM 10044 / NBRC 100330 / Delta H) TaxID=187420 RepID=O26447_METTH|nr:oligosaccharide flippase family protein [Methanothermobacter thermautotrophicus]AAB84853.1 O-antigen transporter [Methanothermobacter thermautotrophicus str. Delta H]WBF06643.1 oligosaccharide flippase family protein [Methanothermobacter thermautotrophicus]
MKIPSPLSNSEHRRVLDNIISLTGIQLVQYLLPLITFPYLTRVLGPANFGKVAFAVAFITYFQILTDYGFNFSATREISIHRDDTERVSLIYSSVMVTKTILLAVTFMAMLVTVFLIDRFRSDYLLYIFTYGLVVGNLLFPVWFFQGVERMRYISILRIVSSLIYTALIFLAVRGPGDYLYVPLINSAGFMAVGLYSQRIVMREFGVKFMIPSPADIREQLLEGWHLFISTLAISLYTTSNRFILGLLVSSATLGYYAVAEDITRALQGIVSPISQAIYPYFSRIQKDDRERAKYELRKMLIFMGVLTFGLSVALVFLAPLIVGILAGPSYDESIPLLQILVFIIFAIGANNILGVQGLVSFGYKEKFTRIVIFAGVVHVGLLLGLVMLLGSAGAAVAVVTTEIIIGIIEYIILRRMGVL